MTDTKKNNVLPFTFGDFTIAEKTRRVLITAELEPTSEGALIQPTGFPDIGPVLYPDPSGKNGLLCLVESEASMANRLEEVCFAEDKKAQGAFRDELKNLPWIKLTHNGKPDGEFITSSTIDGHRFASEYVLRAKGKLHGKGENSTFGPIDAQGSEKEFFEFVIEYLEMPSGSSCPAANIPRIFKLAMQYDPMSLLHGFQISLKKKITFVGLRSARTINASIVATNCTHVTVPGVKFDPIGTGDVNQAIFQRSRITAKTLVAQFSIDVAGILSFGLTQEESELLLKIALCKVAWFLEKLNDVLKLRTECVLQLKGGTAKYTLNRKKTDSEGNPVFDGDFDFAAIIAAAKDLQIPHSERAPLVLKHTKPKKEDTSSNEDNSD
ncbi:MAG TPA: type I-U CRISPR-associated protein Cas7, partial [Thermogutta sp.]|nr:type I-U CRISPR-associated protein Cas7 [Thermogutta sp.]